jgi:hypothetical protein
VGGRWDEAARGDPGERLALSLLFQTGGWPGLPGEVAMRTTLFPVLLAACLFSPAQTEARQIDQRLAERVGERVTSYAGLTIFDHVTVTVTRGVVTLGGAVTTPLKKREIGDLAGAVRGVERVENTVRVLPALPSDSRLRLAIAQAIYDHPAVRPYAGRARPEW